MTPVLLQQFRIFYASDRPVGVLLWAFVSEEVERRLAQGVTRLRPQDWKSGDQLWVVEAIAPFGGPEEMIKDLRANVFSDARGALRHYDERREEGSQGSVIGTRSLEVTVGSEKALGIRAVEVPERHH